MTTPPFDPRAHVDPQARLDEYLDGGLSPSDRAAFERELAADAALRESVELQRRLDDSLRRSLRPEAITPPAPARQWGGRWSVRGLGLAAAILLLVAGGVWAMFALRPQGPLEDPVIAHIRTVEAGFKPYAVCTSDAEFARFTRVRLGCALHTDADPSNADPSKGLVLVGWSYDHKVLSEGTVTLLATFEGKPVTVFMDKSRHDKNVVIQGDDCHNVFRGKTDHVVMYEVSEFKNAVVIPRIRGE